MLPCDLPELMPAFGFMIMLLCGQIDKCFANIHLFLFGQRSKNGVPPSSSFGQLPASSFIFALLHEDYCKAKASNKATMVKKEEGEA